MHIHVRRVHFFFVVIVMGALCGWPLLRAHALMQSTDYTMSFDAIDIGGANSTSTSFTIEDTLGESATGNSSSTNYSVNAGYQQMFGSFISISVPSGVTMSSINGLAGGTSTSSITWTIVTDDPVGYNLTMLSSTSPALLSPGGASFADYSPAGAAPDFSFTVASSQSLFAFSPSGSDIIARYLNNGSACNTGSTQTLNTCWDGFSTTTKSIAQSSAPNQPLGTPTTLNLEAGIGASRLQDSGTYTATITATAVAL